MASIKSRSAYKGQLTSVKTAISRYHEDESLLSRDGARAYLETNLEICDRIRVRYNRVQDEIINQAESEEEREREIEEQNDFLLEIDEAEEKLTELIVNVKVNESAKKDLFHSTVIEDERIDKLLDGFSKLVERMDGSENSKYSKLEPVKIPIFNGEHAQWRSFKDMFINLVDSNKKLSKTQKLHHLKTKLTGKAFDAIDHLDMCDENYDIAWETITNRFECKKKVINSHIERIKSLPTLKNPIADDLRNIYDVSTTTINAMDALKVNTRDPWIIYEVLSKLDHETQTLWSQEQSDVPTWDEFKVFLNKRCKALDLCPSMYTSNVNSSGSKVQNQKPKIVKSLTISKENSSQKHESCSVCKKSAHKLWKCGKFKSLPAAKRLETVNNLNLCMNCISESRSQHAVDKCPYPPCKHCNKSHNYWVHDALSHPPSKVTQDNPQSVSEDQKKPAVLSSFLPSNKSANGEIHRSILKTACVRILDSQQNVHVCRALLDFGSEISVMTTELCQRLRLKLQKSPYTQVEGFQGQVSSLKHQVNAILIPQVGTQISLQCQVSQKISTNLPTSQINPRDVRVPTGFVLADSEWHVSRPIDLLIGAAHEDEIMLDEVYKMGPGIPSLRNTVFGWVVCGKWQPNGAQSADTPPVCHTISLKTIDETLRKFWELEELSEECPQTVEYREVEELYSSTTKRSENGQYNVRLPLKGNFGELGSNRKRASRQLNFLERRLSQNPQLYKEYSNIFEEYLSLGIIERVPLIELQAKSYYMTHHCVVRENASSTKVRIVFNCGSVSETGISLNEVIKVGPVVQPELIEILWRFRRFPIALSCDIVKMYLQVQLNEDHRDLQRFLWRTSPSEPIMDYRFKTLCFGNAASPYLATKTLIKLAEDEGENYPRAAEVLRNNFYVDDCLVSVETTKEAIEVQKDLISLLGKAQMKLSKWQSNSPTVLQTVQEGNAEAKEVSISDGCVKALGLMWNPSNDTFSFQVDTMVENLVPTKRNILRVVARIYDPLGLLAPITINAKLILQNLWKNEIDWDTEVEGDILREWKKFIVSLQYIPSMRISRWTSKNENVCEEQLHMFSDASNVAYGAAVYHVTKDVSGRVSSQMLTAKSKVAPIKTKTIPKLELCAATLGAKLLAKVAKSLKISKVYCWVDAKVVLAQIASASNKQDVFTKNRVTTIRELTAVECWRHVPTKENPADLISRGTSAMELNDSSLYWEGPHWLKESDLAWESKESVPPAVEESQDISVATLTVNKSEENYIFKTLVSKISNLSRMKRVLLIICKVGQLLRFRALRTKGHAGAHPNQSTIHSAADLVWAENQLIKWDQESHFPELIQDLMNNKVVTINSASMKKLHPFLDEERILRVGGRLGHLDDDYNTKYPKILPRSDLTKLIIREMHLSLLHPGPQLLLAHCRRRYWPIGGRHITRNVVHMCKACFVHKTSRENQIMADLPKHRISLVRAFSSVAIDCCGPFFIRTGAESRGRTQRIDIVVFVCTSTKAVHLEIVSSLSSEAFMSSFRRFTSRRGVCKEVFSDNGRNFLGASRELQRLLAEEAQTIQDQTSNQNITWHFQPARSPHFNGLVEAAVKSAKTHLKKVIGEQRLNYEEFYTILTQVEAVLNSRPITILSDDPRDPQPLTPGHFLLLAPPTQLPDENLASVRMNHLTRWQLCQRIVQDFVRKWRLSYLHTLQERSKWHTEKENLKVDDIVILHDASIGTTKWTTGRVVGVHTGGDGKVRVIDIKTPTGTYTRSVTKVAKFPTCESHDLPREHV